MSPTHNPADDATDDSIDFGDLIDQATFDQVLEMDDEDDDREFSKGIVFGFFEQAEATFDKMQLAIESRDLGELSSLGHFLKGSSATLGLTKVRDACERIQHYGSHRDETGTEEVVDDDKCIALIKRAFTEVKTDYEEVSALLKKFYGES
ncbi:putative phosphotransmitter protein ypd1 [Phaeomoniella chlamydospora]|uniref:Putative phosphotransmitter protein ypd1 n=1 Tax=Phaeomoniella chlamydospora TaxID=158046 RepID=A0A0G2F3P6_PHACM|nr:putative phosphotransmitter protein ypd1 [Phaeomoniella chlamydospora]